MTTIELTRIVIKRFSRVKYFILLFGVAVAVALFFYAKSKQPLYTAYASLYPLTNTENTGAGGLLGAITGNSGGGGSNNLSQEASISLDEMANSRRIMESVALEKLPTFNNKTIARLLIENYNKGLSFPNTKIEVPKDEMNLKAIGATFLKEGIIAKSNKNELFQIYYTSTAKELISPITYIFIDKVTEFYTNLKVQKAKSDLDFTERKIDSLRDVLGRYDRRAININNTTMFTTPSKIEYTIPKENLINDKTRVLGIYNLSANNKEEALWRMQRATPILSMLDKPDPPFSSQVPSAGLYATIGFFIGCILGAIIFITDILYNFSKKKVNTAVYGNTAGVVIVEETIVVTESNDKVSTTL